MCSTLSSFIHWIYKNYSKQLRFDHHAKFRLNRFGHLWSSIKDVTQREEEGGVEPNADKCRQEGTVGSAHCLRPQKTRHRQADARRSHCP